MCSKSVIPIRGKFDASILIKRFPSMKFVEKHAYGYNKK